MFTKKELSMTLGQVIKYIADNIVFDVKKKEERKKELLCYIKERKTEKKE